MERTKSGRGGREEERRKSGAKKKSASTIKANPAARSSKIRGAYAAARKRGEQKRGGDSALYRHAVPLGLSARDESKGQSFSNGGRFGGGEKKMTSKTARKEKARLHISGNEAADTRHPSPSEDGRRENNIQGNGNKRETRKTNREEMR